MQNARGFESNNYVYTATCLFETESVKIESLNGNDYEIVNGSGFQKAIDITYDSVVDGSQTFSFIEAELIGNEIINLFNHLRS